ncbi:MAG: adenylate/guanylate cyclase domain-containing protein [Snowella sp.]|nr:adenylate/guanylate cyclase domain-containing protein [Snowella sp.]
MLSISLLTLFLTGFISFSSSRDTLTTTAYNHLNGLRNARAQAIEQYFETIYDHVMTMSEAPLVISSIKAFIPAYQQLENLTLTAEQKKQLDTYYNQVFIPQLKAHVGGKPSAATYGSDSNADAYLTYYYTAKNPYSFPYGSRKFNDPQDGSEYSKVHNQYNARLRNIAEAFNYDDVYFIDANSGIILYSLAKGIDLGSNLNRGYMSETGLAKAYRAAKISRDPKFIIAVDFEKYKPAYGAPSAFVATTIFDGDRLIGVLVFRITPKKIDQIMNANRQWEQVGMGKTGETLLVGQDSLLRSSPRVFLADPQAYYQALEKNDVPAEIINLIKSSGSPILIQKNANNATQNALNGKSGTDFYRNFNGKRVFASYQPITLGDFKWALIAKMDETEIFQGITTLARQLLVMMAILIPLLTLGSIWIARLFMAPIRRLIAANQEVAAGNTNISVKVNSKDEFGQLSRSFNDMAKTLTEKETYLQFQIAENERLLLNILPPKAAERMKAGEQDTVDYFDNVTVLFAEVEGFDELAKTLPPDEAIFLLNDIIGAFDEAAEDYGIDKLQIPGPNYLAACGISIPKVDHAKRMVDFALTMLEVIYQLNEQRNLDLSLSIGLHSGAISAGVVGRTKFHYSLWGETINLARVIHSSSRQNVIHVTQSVVKALEGLYQFDPIEAIAIKGKGKIPVWTLTLPPSSPSERLTPEV